MKLETIKEHYTHQTEKLLFTFDQIEQTVQEEKNRLLVDINKHFNCALETIENKVRSFV